MTEYYNLYLELVLAPDNYDIPAWILAEKEGGYVREYFEQCLSFLFYGLPGTEEDFIKVMTQPEHFDKDRFFSFMPEILESVLDDSHMQKNFVGFFSEYMVNLVSVNSSNLGVEGIQKIVEICNDWEGTLGEDRASRLGERGDWGLGREYRGFKNSLGAILSYNYKK